jgi:hypothetical protein
VQAAGSALKIASLNVFQLLVIVVRVHAIHAEITNSISYQAAVNAVELSVA